MLLRSYADFAAGENATVAVAMGVLQDTKPRVVSTGKPKRKHGGQRQALDVGHQLDLCLSRTSTSSSPSTSLTRRRVARRSRLEERNQSAAGSLAEGLEETLTLHRLSVYALLGRSFKTTNCLESVNALVEERCAKVDHWKNSNQRQRWLVTALVDIEPPLRKVVGYRHLPKMREALKRELKLENKTSGTSMKRVA